MIGGGRVVVIATVLLWLVAGASAWAQESGQAPSLRPHRITLSGGATFTGGYDIGDATALLRGNAVGPSAPPFTLFRSETSVDAAAAGDVRVGYAFARSLSVEASFGYSRPGLTTRLSQDAEAPGVTLDAERLAQYVIDVGVLWQLPRPVIAGRMRPFVIGGAGYLRQLYSERSLVETGRVYFAGGGLRYWLRGGDGTRRSLGVRGDLRAQWRAGGVEFAGRVRIVPIAAIYVFAEL